VANIGVANDLALRCDDNPRILCKVEVVSLPLIKQFTFGVVCFASACDIAHDNEGCDCLQFVLLGGTQQQAFG
jgi:hypothetical protein